MLKTHYLFLQKIDFERVLQTLCSWHANEIPTWSHTSLQCEKKNNHFKPSRIARRRRWWKERRTKKKFKFCDSYQGFQFGCSSMNYFATKTSFIWQRRLTKIQCSKIWKKCQSIIFWGRYLIKKYKLMMIWYTSIRAFRTPSDFPITKEKWSLGHMDEISEVGLLLSRLNLTINWSKVWPKFEFEFSLPLPWLVNSKIFRNYF